MSAYATVADFEATIPGWATTDADALQALLDVAEDDVDYEVGPWTVETNGRKFGAPATTNEKALTAGQVVALTKATCWQAYAWHLLGQEHMAVREHEQVTGPDYATVGRRGPWSPLAGRLLSDAGLVRRTARLRLTSIPSLP